MAHCGSKVAVTATPTADSPTGFDYFDLQAISHQKSHQSTASELPQITL